MTDCNLGFCSDLCTKPVGSEVLIKSRNISPPFDQTDEMMVCTLQQRLCFKSFRWCTAILLQSDSIYDSSNKAEYYKKKRKVGFSPALMLLLTIGKRTLLSKH